MKSFKNWLHFRQRWIVKFDIPLESMICHPGPLRRVIAFEWPEHCVEKRATALKPCRWLQPEIFDFSNFKSTLPANPPRIPIREFMYKLLMSLLSIELSLALMHHRIWDAMFNAAIRVQKNDHIEGIIVKMLYFSRNQWWGENGNLKSYKIEFPGRRWTNWDLILPREIKKSIS